VYAPEVAQREDELFAACAINSDHSESQVVCKRGVLNRFENVSGGRERLSGTPMQRTLIFLPLQCELSAHVLSKKGCNRIVKSRSLVTLDDGASRSMLDMSA